MYKAFHLIFFRWYKEQVEFFKSALKRFMKNREKFVEILPTLVSKNYLKAVITVLIPFK